MSRLTEPLITAVDGARDLGIGGVMESSEREGKPGEHQRAARRIVNRRKDANSLKAIIDKFDLILNNELGAIKRPNSRDNISIIDLTFITTSIGLLNS
jgi:hypothetical protein